MATRMEFAQRMLTKRPTVARASARPTWLPARSPTRARDPRTEITRPKDVTMIEPGCEGGSGPHYARRRLEKRLNRGGSGFVKSAVSRSGIGLGGRHRLNLIAGFCRKTGRFGLAHWRRRLPGLIPGLPIAEAGVCATRSGSPHQRTSKRL